MGEDVLGAYHTGRGNRGDSQNSDEKKFMSDKDMETCFGFDVSILICRKEK